MAAAVIAHVDAVGQVRMHRSYGEEGGIARQRMLIQQCPGRGVLEGKEINAEPQVVSRPDTPGPERDADFRVTYLSKGSECPA
jgi:hypothetical protein